jgi:hypothetical protein
LYALAKQVQWKWPATHDCDKVSYFKHKNQHPPLYLITVSCNLHRNQICLHFLAKENQQDIPSSFDDMAQDGAALSTSPLKKAGSHI